MPFDVKSIRSKFPILQQTVNDRPLVYLDNAATTQKPEAVIERMADYYRYENSNIHRAAHYLSQKATTAYEQARETVRSFIHARHAHEVIFTRGTTEAINLVAHSFGKRFLGPGDEVVISAMEHHANIVPWQIACEEHGARLRIAPINREGELRLDALQDLLNQKTRLVAVTHVSNALGSVNPVREIVRMAHKKEIPVLIDGAQALAHMAVDVQELDCDFYCFSGHKMYGPMGVGVLYGKEALLSTLPPYQSGGEMIREVRFEKTTYNELPFRFEAGTPSVADVLGLEAAAKFILQTGHREIAAHEDNLLQYTVERLEALENVRFIGTAKDRTSVVSFVFTDIHPYDTGTILDKLGIAIRTGHHCAQPLMEFYNVPGTVRVSLGMYNTRDETDRLAEALGTVREMFG